VTRRWLGIRYARVARFAAPAAIAFDPGRDATAFGPAAPQPTDSPLGEIVPGMRVEVTGEVECLTLNVWAPDGEGPFPVLVWFPGGSFVIGSTAQAVYDGTRFADEQQVVVVTVNYRLGALGFLDARPFGGVANCGLRDAICALEWLRDHVAMFGGDASRVVAFGESAGGGLVLHSLASPKSRGLLAGAIVQSGATFATLDRERAALVTDALCVAAGVDDPRALLTLPVDALIAAQVDAMRTLLGTIGMMPFHPMVDNDVLRARPADALATSDIPLLAGTTADEMALFVVGPAPDAERLVRRVAKYRNTDEQHARAVIVAYAKALGTDVPATVWEAIFSDAEMQLPLRAMLDAHPHAFTYLFAWPAPKVGACHGIDIPFTFGNFVDGWDDFVGADDDASALSGQMRDAWAAFARTGNPGWPEYPAAMVFDRASRVEPVHPTLARAESL
jgi:para-nitrobenzyl esterase